MTVATLLCQLQDRRLASSHRDGKDLFVGFADASRSTPPLFEFADDGRLAYVNPRRQSESGDRSV